MASRVFVTGLGVCASNGLGVPAFWESLRLGRSGIAPISRFDASSLMPASSTDHIHVVESDY